MTIPLLAGTAGCGFLDERLPLKTENTGNLARPQLEILPETLVDGAHAAFALRFEPQADGGLVALIDARAAHGLKALYAALRFDPARWQPGLVEWTDALGPGGQRLALTVGPADPGGLPGSLVLGCVQANWDRQPGFSGSSSLCRVRFMPAKSALIRSATGTAAQPESVKTTADAPSSPGAAAELSYDPASQTLSWYYAFPGDYDQNGEASITDLTMLGRHFLAQSPGGPGVPFAVGSLERQVDGDNNGVINFADLTPLGQNIGRLVGSYLVYRSLTRESYPLSAAGNDRIAPDSEVVFAAGTGDPASSRLQFAEVLSTPLAAGENAWVRPNDKTPRTGQFPGTPSPSYPDGWTLDDDPPPPPAELRAFPGAEGFGAFATGGRGGQVIYVTNLNTSGPGSLQAALDTPGPKYVLFKVSGVINGHVLMTRGDVTVAGHSSPGGIIVRGWICDPEPYVEDDATGLATHPQNFILRHLRSRPDFENAALGGTPSDDGLRLHHAVNGIVDHFSIANANDEAVQISWTRDVTIQNTLLAETLGDHAYLGGMLVNYSNPADGWPLTRLSIHHNCWNRIMGRMPELSRESPNAAGSIMELELSNNLLWDPGINIQVAAGRGQLDAAAVYYALNWVGNRAVGRAVFPEPTAQAAGWTFSLMTPDFLQLASSQTTTYFQDNVNDSYAGFTDYQQLFCCNDYDQQVALDPGGLPFPSNTNPGAFARSTRHAFPAITYTPSGELVDYMLEHAGARPRDPLDRRLMQWLGAAAIDPARRDVKHAANDTYELDFDPGSPPPAPLDTDSDGMPDTWETVHGLNPNTQDHNGTGLSLAETGVEGYTNLEVYLNELADSLLS